MSGNEIKVKYLCLILGEKNDCENRDFLLKGINSGPLLDRAIAQILCFATVYPFFHQKFSKSA